jgi:hypothetical protein
MATAAAIRVAGLMSRCVVLCAACESGSAATWDLLLLLRQLLLSLGLALLLLLPLLLVVLGSLLGVC